MKISKRQLAILEYLYSRGACSQVQSVEISQSELANTLKITRQALSSHLRKLRDMDIIRTGRRFIDITAQGLSALGKLESDRDAFVFIKVKPYSRNKVYKRVVELVGDSVYRVTGDIDLIIFIEHEKLMPLLDEISREEGIVRTSAHVVLERLVRKPADN